MRILIPMAGIGKRMRPHTLLTPKPLLPIIGKPIVQLLLEDLEIRHTEIKNDTIDTVPLGHDLYEYLPDVDMVVKEVNELYGK